MELRCQALAPELASALERNAARSATTPDGHTFVFRDVAEVLFRELLRTEPP